MKKFLALLLVTIFFAACSNEPTVQVSTADVISEGTVTVTRDGKISLGGAEKIFSPVSGNVVDMYFERGGNVELDQPLFKIGNATDESELLKARAALGEAMAALARAMADRNPDAYEIQATVDEARSLVVQLENSAAKGIVLSPTAGKIFDNVQLGAKVTANETVLAEIGKENPVAVRFEISDVEKNLLLSSPALKITLKLSDGSIYPREGKLNFVEPAAIDATFDNPTGRLILGDTVQVVIDGVKISNTMLVPENSVQQRDGGDFVFVVASNKTAALKKISTGGKIGNLIIVNNGLQNGDKVVVDGLTNLREGTPLSVMNDK